MTVLDITLTEIGPGDLQLEEDVPLLGQAQMALLVVGVVAVPFLVYYAWGQTVPLLIRVKQRAGRRAGEAVAVFPHNVDHIRSRAAQHMIVMLCKTTGGTCGS